MKNSIIKNRILWGVGTALALTVCFLLCRYTFFSYHGNKDWSVVLFVAGLVILGIAAVFNAKITMTGTVIGYIVGFAAGIAFGADKTELNGGVTNNWWQIWSVLFIVIIAIGVVIEILIRRFKR